MKGNFHVQFGIGGGEGDLVADHTKSRKRKLPQKGYGEDRAVARTVPQRKKAVGEDGDVPERLLLVT